MAKVQEKEPTQTKEKKGVLPIPKGKLLAIGGKESKSLEKRSDTQQGNKSFISEQILKRFVDELPGKDPLVVIIPAASSVPDESAQDYLEVFKHLGIKNMEVVDIRSRDDAKKPENVAFIDKAAGIMLTGGDQLRLTSILGGSPFLERIKERYTKNNFVIAGTSAGAAAMSTSMIYAGETQGGMLKGQMSATAGLDLLKNVAIDTHFIDRGRIIRMAQAVAQNPGCIGIGLEEDTAIMVTEGRNIEVLGNGLITVVNGMDITYTNIYEIGNGEPFTVQDLKVHFLNKGECFRLTFYEQLHI